MQRCSLVFIALISGCGATASGTGDDLDAGVDTPVDDDDPDAAPDAPPDGPPAPACDPLKPWGTPTPVTNINTASRDFQAMVVDDTTAFFATDRGGSVDLYTTTRASTEAEWGAASPLAGFTTSGGETSPYVTADGLTLFYTYAPQGVVNGEIYVATRTSTGVAFGPGAAVANVNGVNDDDGDVVVNGDGDVMYFASNRDGGVYHLYRAVKGVGGSFGAATPVTELNSTVYDAHPRMTSDGLHVYFSSMRTGTGTKGGTEIWKSSRETAAAVWGTPTLVTELNTVSNESPTYVSDDDCYMLIQSDRAGGSGTQDVWEARRPL